MIGQIDTALPDGTLLLSGSREVEDGARAALVHVPGLFRVDVWPREDTLRVVVRNLSDGPCSWSERSSATIVRDDAALELRPSAIELTVDVAERHAEVLIGIVVEPDDALVRFTAQTHVTGR